MKAIFEVKFMSQANALVEALVENGYEVDVRPVYWMKDSTTERIVGYRVEVSKDESHTCD